MRPNISNFLLEVKNILYKYMDTSKADEFYSILTGQQGGNETQTFSSMDDLQLKAVVNSSASYRSLIDSVITYSEKCLKVNSLLELMWQLGQLMISSGELDLATEINESILTRTQNSSEPKRLKAEAFLALSRISWTQGIWPDSFSNVNNANALFIEIDDLCGCAKCENMLGTIYGEIGEIHTAMRHFEMASEILSQSGEPDKVIGAMIEVNIGIFCDITGEPEKAMEHYLNALKTYEELNDFLHIARIRYNLGMLHCGNMNFEEAKNEFNKCISVSIKNGYLSNCAIAYLGKAFVYTKLNEPIHATAFTDKAMEIAYKINDTLSIADIYKVKGMILANLDDFDLAKEFLENSLRLNKDFENKFNQAESSTELGKVQIKMNSPKEALVHLKNASSYYLSNKLTKVSSNLQALIESTSTLVDKG